MLIANVFALFDQGLRFRAIGDVPDEITSIAPDRWDVNGEVGVATTTGGRVQIPGDVDQLLLLLASDYGMVDTGRLHIIAALPVEDLGASLALIAIATEQLVAVEGWSDTGDRRLKLQRTALEEEARRDLTELREELGDQIESLRVQLAQSQREKVTAEQLYRTARTSSAYRLGNLLGESARHPLRAVTGLPRGLSEIARDRPQAAAQAERSAELVTARDVPVASVVRLPRTSSPEGWSAPAIPPISELGVKVAFLAHPFYGGPRRSPWQCDILPGDHIDTLESTFPDAVVVDASATLSGSPWAGSGTFIDQGMAAEVVEVVKWSNRSGIPTVFRWDLPPYQAPVFSRIAASCDLVVATERGGIESAPLLRHGVAPGTSANREPMRAITRFSSPELGSDHSGQAPGTTPEAWVSRRADEAAIHSPQDVAHILSRTGVAVFPETAGVPLTLLEAVASGAATVAAGRIELPFVVDPTTLLWEDTELISLQARAFEERLTTAWAIRDEFSTLAETRALGRWLGVANMSDTGGVTAVLTVSNGSEPAARAFVDEVAGLIDVLIVTGESDNADPARRIAAVANEHGILAMVAAAARDLAGHIRATTKRSWWVWPVDPVRIGGSAAVGLRTMLTGLESDPQSLLAAHSLLALTDEHLAEAARPKP